MPDPEDIQTGEISDSSPNSGPNTPDIAEMHKKDTTIDAIVVTVKKDSCKVLTAKEYGLDPSEHPHVKFVQLGTYCQTPVPEAITEGCETSDVIEVQSYIVQDGIVFVLYTPKGYDLRQGEILYNAFRGICGAFPDSEISVMGVEIMPTETEPVSAQAGIEKTAANLTVRLHMWKGSAIIKSADKTLEINLGQGQQIVIDPQTFKILEAYCIQELKKEPLEIQPQPAQKIIEPGPESLLSELSDVEPVTAASHPGGTETDGGCISAPKEKIDAPGSIFSLIIILLVMKLARYRIAELGAPFKELIKLITGPNKK